MRAVRAHPLPHVRLTNDGPMAPRDLSVDGGQDLDVRTTSDSQTENRVGCLPDGSFIIEDWGLIDYSAAVDRQLLAVDEIAGGNKVAGGGGEKLGATRSDFGAGGESIRIDTAKANCRNLEGKLKSACGERLIFCSHPPLVSVGRGTKPGDIFGWKGAILETARGGRATYHGPSQIVVYPILNLNIGRVGFKPRDIHGYMHALECAIVETLGEVGIVAKAGSELEREGEFEVEEGVSRGRESGDTSRESESPSLTGVWVCDKKIASVGIGVRKGISYHGLALNVENDPQAFQGINPCGFTTDKMTSVESEIADYSVVVNALRKDLKARLQKNLLKQLKITT